ncbi:Tryptophan synthase alpha chain [Sedimentisphaera cyanobacteriorum]|uniref:Tryptophan synthase alpha chain n=1 Tax=Sedimentisphaera cyanobacteriorum TaxID=1940790 RepID=A0A1Q2HLI3_9BACT|nr:tryptophan synthase subunit alpha [Sedimentisphaera cyanobacteriorum]AQQ08429.1 Tryptophan synthase alpha chain [Sedimentisphaera cyanobacteriorum]
MSRIKETFNKLKNKNAKALAGFITAGDPTIEGSLAIASEMFDNGLDILELGVPFSDPTADGDVIQRSSARALMAGANLSKIIQMTAKLREKYNQPIIIFSYLNPIYRYGYERFIREAIEAGADGLLAVDMPIEESEDFKSIRNKHSSQEDFALIKLAAPTTNEARLETICRAGEGFIYMINRVGITGTGGLDPESVAKHARQIKQHTDLPVCMGFGISSPEDAEKIAFAGEGIVVGSLFEKTIEKNLDKGKEVYSKQVGETVRAMKAPLR